MGLLSERNNVRHRAWRATLQQYHYGRASQMCSRQKRFVEPMLVSCWPTVYDVGPTWKHHSLPNNSNVINLHHPQKIKQKHLKYISFFSDEQIFLLWKNGNNVFLWYHKIVGVSLVIYYITCRSQYDRSSRGMCPMRPSSYPPISCLLFPLICNAGPA